MLETTGQRKGSPKYDLEDRLFEFAKNVRALMKQIPRTIANAEDGRQVIRSSGSMGANYIEANEALSKKDFRMRIRICRKESKETAYWLRLLDMRGAARLDGERLSLVDESNQLMKIFAAILRKSEDR